MAPLGTAAAIGSRFAAYVDRLAPALGHADRRAPFRAYCTGLILPGDRKSVEPMAVRVERGRVGAAHQSLHHFVAKVAWDYAAVLGGVRDLVLPTLLKRGPVRAWIIDDTGMPKKAGYGNDTALRQGVTALGLTYVAGVQSSLTVWPPDVEPLPPKPWSGKGRPPKLLRRAPGHEPISVKALAEGLAPDAWRSVTWREGTNAPLASRFAAVRVRAAHRDEERTERRPEEWLLIEWPEDEEKPTKSWLSTLPETMPLEALVETAKLRWRIERDYLELTQELGLGHYEAGAGADSTITRRCASPPMDS